jgi:integrase
MATIENRNGNFRVIFYHAGRRHAAALKAVSTDDADRVAARVEETLGLIRRGSLIIPSEADFVQFVLSGGRQTELPQAAEVRTFKELRDRYLDVLGIGAVEANSLLTIRIHLDHICRTLGAHFQIQSLKLADLQAHVTRRRRQKGRRGRPVQTATLKKEIASFRACWNWGLKAGLLKSPFPNQGLMYPKEADKFPFMTFAEIERKAATGGLPADEVADLWDALFLTQPEIDELLSHVRRTARLDWIYPMFVFAAHTGARRSEMIRARVVDIDFVGEAVQIRERKKDKTRETFRRVPMTATLKAALETWLSKHPGGPNLFTHNVRAEHSKKREEPLGIPLGRPGEEAGTSR